MDVWPEFVLQLHWSDH